MISNKKSQIITITILAAFVILSAVLFFSHKTSLTGFATYGEGYTTPCGGIMDATAGDSTFGADKICSALLDGLTITCNSCTLDCLGHSFSGSGVGEGQTGLIIQGTSVTIQNCDMNDWYLNFSVTGSCIDGGGNDIADISSVCSAGSVTDNPPTVTLTSPDNTLKNRTRIQNFSCTSTDDFMLFNITLFVWDTTSVYYQNKLTINGTANFSSWELIDIPDENYSWNCLVFDNNSQGVFASANRTLWIDNIAPVFTNLANQTINYTDSLSYQLTATDDRVGVGCFSVNDTTNFAISCSGLLTNAITLTTNIYHINISVNDTVGNTNSSLLDINATTPLDQILPTIHLRSPVNATKSNQSSQNFSCNITDDIQISNLTIYIWNSTSLFNQTKTNLNGTTNSTSWIINLSRDDNYTWNCVGYDSQSNFNWSNEKNYSILIDTVIPVVALSSPLASESTTLTDIIFIYNVTDLNNITNCSLIIADVIDQTTTSPTKVTDLIFSKTFAAIGDYVWQVNCIDEASNPGNATPRILSITSDDDGDGGGGGGGGGGTCTPSCSGKVCGDNGCGGSCGTCLTNQTCSAGICISNIVICTESWTCGNWTECIGGIKTRICTDNNSCGTAITRPATTMVCVVNCTENFVCGNWTDCINKQQSRTCTDANSCSAEIKTDIQTCEIITKTEEVPENVAPPSRNFFRSDGNLTIKKPSDIIPHGDVPAVIVDTAVYTTAAAAVVGGFQLAWLWIFGLLIPLFMLRLRHYCVAIIDVNAELPFVETITSHTGKTMQTSLKVKREKIVEFINLLSKNLGEKIIYAEQLGNYYRFVFEKGGFLELQIDIPLILNAHFSSGRKSRRFYKALKLSLIKLLKDKGKKDIEMIMKNIYITSETSSIFSSLRSMNRAKKLRKLNSRFIKKR